MVYKNLPMSKQLSDELRRRSRQCERGVIAISASERAGFAYVAPNLLLWSWIPVEDYDAAKIFDLALN